MPAEQQSYDSVSADYFAKCGLRRYAGVAFAWSMMGPAGISRAHHALWNRDHPL